MFKQTVSVLLVTIAISLINAEVVNWTPCDSPTNCEIKEVRINPCSSAPAACKFKRGSAAALEFDFVPEFQGTAGNLTAKIFWAKPDGDTAFPGMNTNACQFTTCPLVPSEQHTYQFSIETSRSYPIRTYDIKMKLTGDDRKECCFTTKIKIVR